MSNFIDRDLFLGTQRELITEIISNVKKKKKICYYAVNPDCMLQYWKNNRYSNILNNSKNVVYVDGIGVIYAQKILGLPVSAERIATTDLFPGLLSELHLNNNELRVFLLGGKEDTAERAKKNMQKKYPNAKIVGTHHGYFQEESEAVLALINELQVDILFVGFGTPIQESWVEDNLNNLNVRAIITCGGLFDYYSNNVKRAPNYLRNIGMEWFYRLMQEPRRLYKRYLFGNIKFLFNIAKLFFSRRSANRGKL